MNYIKNQRQLLGFTQLDLVDETGLSLRTIQRLEADDCPPKGHSLRMIAKAFDISPIELVNQYVDDCQENDEDTNDLKLINLSILAFIGIPFGNIILPYYLLRKKKSQLVQEIGKKILSWQICFSIFLSISLCIAPFIPTRIPLILIVLFTLMVLNVIWVFRSAQAIDRDELEVFDLPITLL